MRASYHDLTYTFDNPDPATYTAGMQQAHARAHTTTERLITKEQKRRTRDLQWQIDLQEPMKRKARRF